MTALAYVAMPRASTIFIPQTHQEVYVERGVQAGVQAGVQVECAGATTREFAHQLL
jgi:hypothetical protein